MTMYNTILDIRIGDSIISDEDIEYLIDKVDSNGLYSLKCEGTPKKFFELPFSMYNVEGEKIVKQYKVLKQAPRKLLTKEHEFTFNQENRIIYIENQQYYLYKLIANGFVYHERPKAFDCVLLYHEYTNNCFIEPPLPILKKEHEYKKNLKDVFDYVNGQSYYVRKKYPKVDVYDSIVLNGQITEKDLEQGIEVSIDGSNYIAFKS